MPHMPQDARYKSIMAFLRDVQLEGPPFFSDLAYKTLQLERLATSQLPKGSHDEEQRPSYLLCQAVYLFSSAYKAKDCTPIINQELMIRAIQSSVDEPGLDGIFNFVNSFIKSPTYMYWNCMLWYQQSPYDYVHSRLREVLRGVDPPEDIPKAARDVATALSRTPRPSNELAGGQELTLKIQAFVAAITVIAPTDQTCR